MALDTPDPLGLLGDRNRSLRDEVLEELRRMIISRTIAPGAMLNETQLAKELGVSRLPVREAFRQLEAEGLLIAIARRGVRVVEPNAAEFEVIHETRLVLELLAVRLTIRKNDPGTMSILDGWLQAGEKAIASRDETTLKQLNAEFHTSLSEGTGSTSLNSTLRIVRQQADMYSGGKHSPTQLSWAEHSAIVRAVLARDSRKATSLMRNHLEGRHEAALMSPP